MPEPSSNHHGNTNLYMRLQQSQLVRANIQNISQFLNTSLTPETLDICVKLLEAGVHPQSLSEAVIQIRNEMAAFNNGQSREYLYSLLQLRRIFSLHELTAIVESIKSYQMDVISPQVMWIGTRCYRVNQTKSIAHQATNLNESQTYVEEDTYGEDDREEEYAIDVTSNGKYQTSFHVPSVFYALIIGTKGQTRQRLEAETKAQIRVPKQGLTGDIVITGTSRKAISTARSRIELIVTGARNKQQFTHFLSVPLNVPEVIKRFLDFRHKVVNKLPRAFCVDESLFQQPDKLHITLCTMSLMDNEDRSNAAQILLDCQESIISPIFKENGSLEIRIRGLEYMNDDPHSVDVLYAKIESPVLQTAANQIYEYFLSKGLMQRKYEQVKLHTTLINSLFRASQTEVVNEKEAERKRITFDASEILRLYGEFDFGSLVLNEIHLSQRFSTSCTGYYEATAVMKLRNE